MGLNKKGRVANADLERELNQDAMRRREAITRLSLKMVY